jgi:hypothetical protein
MEKKNLHTYSKLIKEYLQCINDSIIIKNSKPPHFLTYIGLNVVLFIFKIILIKTGDQQKAFLDSQKAYFYYLEYIEQIKNSNIIHNLCNLDAIKFVYNKSLTHILTYIDESSIETNESVLAVDHETLEKDLYKSFEKRVNVLFCWENRKITLENRIEISKKHLVNYLSIEEEYSYIFDYLETIIEKMNMDFQRYDEFCSVFYQSLVKRIKSKKIPTASEMEDICMTHFLMRNDEEYESESIRVWVKRLLIATNR